MKKIIIVVAAIIIGSFLFSVPYGCKKKNNPTPVDSVLPSDATKLQATLTITGGSLTSGTLPIASVTNAPVLSGYQSSASINPNHHLMLPFNYTSIAGVSKVYIQVSGATNGIIIINMSSSINSGTIIVDINIPGLVKYGNFTLDYLIIDNSGNVSNMLTTDIYINAPMTCANASVSGSEGLTFTTVDMSGKASGTMSLNYDTYTVPDRIDVYQGSTWLTGTGSNPNSTTPPQCDCSTPLPGFVGQAGVLTFPYDASKVKEITVVVSGCLGGGTAWDWSMVCPN